MDNASGHTMNLANSIIGVSILAMPYCFKQCGVLLSVFLLLISSIISRLACHFLLKSAIIARRKTFEFLAFHIFGPLGKFLIEIGMIGFLLGTCIAFFVVMGDLGPAIISEMAGVNIGSTLRNCTLVALAIFCVLPLGLLRNVDSLNGVSKATIGFYCCLVLKIVLEALPHIFTGDWVSEVTLWRPAGILQCLPIFSMALFCQTQLFEIYQAIPNASLEKMNGLIRVAVNMCTWVYIFVGAFGYIAFFQKPFMGNILLSFKPSVTSDVIKMCFVLSLAFSFPLVIFPCRASLYSLLYKGTSYTNLHEGSTTNYIPEGKFQMLTMFIVLVSLIVGIMIPSIELVLGLIGSTIGVMICVLFPVTCFICISPRNTNERILAQIMLFVGVIVMVLGTYANLYAIEEANLNVVTEKVHLPPEIVLQPINMVEPEKPVMDIPTTIKIAFLEEKKQNPAELEQVDVPVELDMKKEESVKEVRHEPPQPEEPSENQTPKMGEEKSQIKPVEDKQGPVVEPVQPPEEKKEKIEIKKVMEEKKEDKQEPVVEPVPPDEKVVEESHKINNVIKEQKSPDVAKKKEESEAKKIEEVDIEAIKKEDIELKADEDKAEKDRNQILLDTLQQQNEVQKEMVEQQKKLIEVIQQQQDNVNNNDRDIVNEQRVKAVKEIENIAKKAIASISGQTQSGKNTEDKNENIEDAAKKAIASLKDEVKQENRNINQDLQGNKETVVKLLDKKTDETAGKIQTADIKTDEILKKSGQDFDQNQNKLNMLPLPIALAKLNNVTLETKEVETKKNSNTSSNNENAKIKAMRRDILSEDDAAKIRAKREVEEAKIEDLNKAVKEVCQELNKITSTEKPIIKMLCKLSEPNLVQAPDLGPIGKEVALDLKPQKRDLKESIQK